MATPTYASPKAAQQAGLVRLAHHATYIAEAAYGHTYIPTPGLRGACGGTSWIGVDRWGRIYYDDKEIMSRPPFEIAVTFMHEVWHTLRCHALRADAFWTALTSDPTLAQVVADMSADARHKLWNLAGDAEINDDLEAQFGNEKDAAGLFDKWITPRALRAQFGIDTRDGASAEEYARAMLEKQIDQSGQDALQQAEPDCGGGSGADGQPRDWEAGEPGEGEGEGAGAPQPPGKDAMALEDMRNEAAKSIEAAAKAGTLPAGMTRWATKALTPPKIRWERELRARMRRAVVFIAGHDDFTYARPSNRRQPGVVLPGTHSPELVVDVILDDSGSMGDGPRSRLARAVAEIDGVCKAATRVRFTACDAAVNSKRTVFEGRAGNVFKRFTGGGGTDMRVGIAAAMASKPRPNMIVVLTDGETPWPSAKPPRCEVIVGLIGASSYVRSQVPKWASVIEID